jgi:hypothetical protein
MLVHFFLATDRIIETIVASLLKAQDSDEDWGGRSIQPGYAAANGYVPLTGRQIASEDRALAADAWAAGRALEEPVKSSQDSSDTALCRTAGARRARI